ARRRGSDGRCGLLDCQHAVTTGPGIEPARVGKVGGETLDVAISQTVVEWAPGAATVGALEDTTGMALSRGPDIHGRRRQVDDQRGHLAAGKTVVGRTPGRPAVARPVYSYAGADIDNVRGRGIDGQRLDGSDSPRRGGQAGVDGSPARAAVCTFVDPSKRGAGIEAVDVWWCDVQG